MKKEKILIFIFLISFIFAGFKANALESIYYFVNLKLSINQGQVGTTVNKQTTSMQKLKKINSTDNRSIQAKVTTNWNNTILESPWITLSSNTTINLGRVSIGYGYYPGPTVLSLKTLHSHSNETNFNGEWIYDTY